MLFFPSLDSRALTQLPYSDSLDVRIAQVLTPSYRTFRYVDAGSIRRVWELQFNYLSDLERTRLSEFFDSARGSFQSFAFVDPFDNLLTASDTLTSPAWHADAQLVLVPGILDPDGATTATRVSNPTTVPGRLTQELPIAAWHAYSSSIFARSLTPSSLSLIAGDPGAMTSRAIHTTGEWKRYAYSFSDTSLSESLTAGVEIGALSEVVLFGPQIEQALVSTPYKPTSGPGGVYPHCRFANDGLTWRTDGVNSHSTNVTITTRI